MTEAGKQQTVMVIDDMPANLNLLEDALAMHGYRVLSFPKGALALEALKQVIPDIILLDIKMPGMSGYQFNEELKRSPETGSIPVIFMSGIDDETEKEKVRAAGGVCLLVKPLDVMGINDTIQQYL